MKNRFILNGALIAIFIALATSYFNVPVLTGSSAVSASDLPQGMQAISTNEIKQVIEKSGDKPELLFIYASWCPYCKKHIEVVNDLLKEGKVKQVTSVSIDKDARALVRFLEKRKHLGFETKLFSREGNLAVMISQAGGRFEGGVPYSAILKNGEIVKGFPGAYPKATFEKALSE